MSKEELLQLLIDSGYTYKKIAEYFKIGVSSQVYQESFGITHTDVKRLEKHKVLRIVGTYDFRAYGRALSAPLYDAYQYANMTDEEMKQYLQEYSKRRVKSRDASR